MRAPSLARRTARTNARLNEVRGADSAEEEDVDASAGIRRG